MATPRFPQIQPEKKPKIFLAVFDLDRVSLERIASIGSPYNIWNDHKLSGERSWPPSPFYSCIPEKAPPAYVIATPEFLDRPGYETAYETMVSKLESDP